MRKKGIENLVKILEIVHREGVAVKKYFTLEFKGQQYKNRLFTKKSMFDIYVN